MNINHNQSHQSLIDTIERENAVTPWTYNLANTSKIDEKLYHGVGMAVNEVVGKSDVDELLKRSNLDWDVLMADGIKYGPDFKYGSDRDRIIYRLNPNGGEPIHLGTVSRRWQPFQNKEVVNSFISFCEKSQLTMERLGSLDSGRIIFAVAKTDQSFVLPGDDIIEGKLLLTNSHKSGRGARVDLMAPRLVCANQLVLPVKVAGQVIAHTSTYSEVRVTKILESAKTGFDKFKEDAEFLSQTSLDMPAAHALVIKILGDKEKKLEEQPKAVQEVLDLYCGAAIGSELLSSYQTAWGLVNSTTEYYNHHSAQRGGASGHVNSLWLGSKRSKQEQVLKQIVSALR